MSANNKDNVKPIISQDIESLSHINCLDYLAFQVYNIFMIKLQKIINFLRIIINLKDTTN